jgi:hypothetical protein
MESIGLMPSSGQPGGKRTGDMMADYPSGGRFLAACESLLTSDFSLSWCDLFPADEHVQMGHNLVSAQLEGVTGSSALSKTTQPWPVQFAQVDLVASLLLRLEQEGCSTQEPVLNKSNRIKVFLSFVSEA